MSLLYHNGKDFVKLPLAKDDLGLDVYLCCPGPSLKDVDPAVFDRPGVMTVAINTAYPHIPKPDLWVCMDGAQCYDREVWTRAFPKVIGSKYMNDTVGDRRLVQYPNVYVADGNAGGLQEMFARRAADAPFLWVGNTFWITMHILVWLGAKRIHLVGCDLSREKGDYCHDDIKLIGGQQKYNAALYESICGNMPFVRAEAEKHGIEIISCTPDSAANKHLEYVALSDALAESEKRMPKKSDMPIMYGATAELCQWRPQYREHVNGVMVASDANGEWMLPWWWDHYNAHNSHPVAFVDMGMSPGAKAFCQARGRLISRPIPEGLGVMRMTPLCMLATTFNKTVWLDLDCEVRTNIAPLFSIIGDRIGFNSDPYTPYHSGSKDPAAGGVIVYNWGDPMVSEWAEYVLSGQFQNNQDALNKLLPTRIERTVKLPKTYQWLRMEGNDPAASIMHWSGPVGHDHIRAQLVGGYTVPKVSILMPAYNAEKYIGDAIRTCLRQSYQNLELIVIDDGSRDNTMQIAAAFAEQDKRMFVRGIQHKGYVGAFNEALSFATGDAIARMDADDLQDTRRIESSVMTLMQYGDKMDAVSCGAVRCDATGKLDQPFGQGMNEAEYLKGNSSAGPIGASIVAWKRVYDSVGPFRDKYPRCPDADWNIRAIDAGVKWGFIPAAFYVYRQHEGQMTKQSAGEQERQFAAALQDRSQAATSNNEAAEA